MRVALFITCFNDTLFPETGKATVRLLERLGHQVDFPLEQTCCGQMHFNTGYQREAIPLARRFVCWVPDQVPRTLHLSGKGVHGPCPLRRISDPGSARVDLRRGLPGADARSASRGRPTRRGKGSRP